jgi:hypothetical protein
MVDVMVFCSLVSSSLFFMRLLAALHPESERILVSNIVLSKRELDD